MKKVYGILLALIIYLPETGEAARYTFPPIPERDESEIIRAVIISEEGEDYIRLSESISKKADIHVRKIFEYALNGFSVEGPRKQIEEIQDERGVLSVSELSSYIMTIDESASFIGATDLRRYYDADNHRLTGKGVKVGIIDTGIDYNHPDLKAAYRGGRDLIDGDDDPMETVGARLLATIHGTHVAGIIAANGSLQGVAPEVELYAYRALGPGGMGNTESVIAAIDAAIRDQMDIVNLSLGNSINGPDLPITVALNKAVEKGIIAVVSNGNAGPEPWTVGSPGTSSKAISVGASSPPLKSLFLQVGLGGDPHDLPLYQMNGAQKWNLSSFRSVVDGGFGRSSELKDVKNNVVFVRRGKIKISEKIANIHESGGIAAIVESGSNSPIPVSVKEQLMLPAVWVTKKDGQFLKDYLHSAKAEKMSFAYKEEKDFLAPFSSRGPVTVSWEIKPDLVAPGIGIQSTVPGGHMDLQGTSMSAPHVTGAAALLKQAHPEWTPEQVKSALMTTAKHLRNRDGDYYKTYEQGAGRLQLQEAVEVDTFFYPSSITFGLFDRQEGEIKHIKKLIVENKKETIQHYSFLIPKDERGLNWSLPLAFSLQPNERRELEIGLSIDAKTFQKGMYDGYLGVREGSKTLYIPYLYMKEEPNYPQVMGFQFGDGDGADTYRYEMYVPCGGDEMAIALFDYESLRFEGFLDYSTPAPAGYIQKEIPKADLPGPGLYRAVIKIRKGGISKELQEVIEIE